MKNDLLRIFQWGGGNELFALRARKLLTLACTNNARERAWKKKRGSPVVMSLRNYAYIITRTELYYQRVIHSYEANFGLTLWWCFSVSAKINSFQRLFHGHFQLSVINHAVSCGEHFRTVFTPTPRWWCISADTHIHTRVSCNPIRSSQRVEKATPNVVPSTRPFVSITRIQKCAFRKLFDFRKLYRIRMRTRESSVRETASSRQLFFRRNGEYIAL